MFLIGAPSPHLLCRLSDIQVQLENGDKTSLSHSNVILGNVDSQAMLNSLRIAHNKVNVIHIFFHIHIIIGCIINYFVEFEQIHSLFGKNILF